MPQRHVLEHPTEGQGDPAQRRNSKCCRGKTRTALKQKEQKGQQNAEQVPPCGKGHNLPLCFQGNAGSLGKVGLEQLYAKSNGQ